jgi:hypothetical protein
MFVTFDNDVISTAEKMRPRVRKTSSQHGRRPKVFVAYAQDSQAHKDAVRSLADLLRSGVHRSALPKRNARRRR